MPKQRVEDLHQWDSLLVTCEQKQCEQIYTDIRCLRLKYEQLENKYMSKK